MSNAKVKHNTSDYEKDIYENFLDMVIQNAETCNRPKLERRLYELALEKIFIHKEPCEKYPNGMPSFREVQRIALEIKLQEETPSNTKH